MWKIVWARFMLEIVEKWNILMEVLTYGRNLLADPQNLKVCFPLHYFHNDSIAAFFDPQHTVIYG